MKCWFFCVCLFYVSIWKVPYALYLIVLWFHSGFFFLIQGRIRNKIVKRASRQLIEKYYSKLTLDFDSNKRITEEVADLPSKRIRNKIAGFATVSLFSVWSFQLLSVQFDGTKNVIIFPWSFILFFFSGSFPFLSQHLMKRIQRGPVRGISLKLQEEERERRMDFIPERSVLDVDSVNIDKDTEELLKSLGLSEVPVNVTHDNTHRRGKRAPAKKRD